MYPIEQAAAKTGVTASRLRMWEERYGWPIPQRNLKTNYRVYTEGDIQILARVKQCLDNGMMIGQILIDGAPVFPGESKHIPVTTHLDLSTFASLERPTTLRGQRFFDDIIKAFVERQFAKVIACIQYSVIDLRPSDREAACFKVVQVGVAKYKELEVDVKMIEDALDQVCAVH